MFLGQLNQNEVIGSIYNMIISQYVFGDNLAGVNSQLVDMFRVDGSQYGDQKLYYAVDALETDEWLNDASNNLLETHRPQAPEVQAIELDVFRQIALTVDNYMSKRAFTDENTFSSFNSVLLGMIKNTKRAYDATTFNSYIGTTEAELNGQAQTIRGGEAGENFGLLVAEKLANLLVELTDISTDYNDLYFNRSYNEKDLVVIWNSEVFNEVKYVDLPVIFHKEGLLGNFEQKVLPAKYFGTINTAQGTTSDLNVSIRAFVEKRYTLPGIGTGESHRATAKAYDPRAKMDKNGTWYVHCFPGQLLPKSTSYAANETYTTTDDVAFKILHKRSVPFMSGFEVGTEFVNTRALNENHYLTFAHNTIEYLHNYPFITCKIVD